MLLDEEKTGGVLYVSRNTYDEALLLSSRFDGDCNRIKDMLKSKKTEVYITVPGLPALITELSNSMPKPLNILAPFLMLCAQNTGMEWNSSDLIAGYGVLHQLSQILDFNSILLVPPEVRANITLPTALLKQYEVSWDELTQSLEDLVLYKAEPVKQVIAQPVNEPAKVVAPTPVQTVTPTPAPVVEAPKPAPAPTPVPVVEEEKEPELSPLEKKLLEIKKQSEERDKAISKKAEEAKVSTPKPAPTVPKAGGVALGAKESEASVINKMLNDFDDV